MHIGGYDQIEGLPQNLEGERGKFGKVLEKCQIICFFDIFWEILNKMKDNLGQECVLSYQGKIGTFVPDFPRKITVFLVLTPHFHLSLPKIWLFHPNIIYFLMSNNRAIRKKSFIMLSLRL